MLTDWFNHKPRHVVKHYVLYFKPSSIIFLFKIFKSLPNNKIQFLRISTSNIIWNTKNKTEYWLYTIHLRLHLSEQYLHKKNYISNQKLLKHLVLECWDKILYFIKYLSHSCTAYFNVYFFSICVYVLRYVLLIVVLLYPQYYIEKFTTPLVQVKYINKIWKEEYIDMYIVRYNLFWVLFWFYYIWCISTLVKLNFISSIQNST